jgi:heme oxygenase
VRVYLPATSALLRRLLDDGSLGPAPVTGFAVTPGLREWYLDDDIEELEYAASQEAARASLRLLGEDPGSARRRVVIAADVADAVVEVRDDLDRGVVRVADVVSLSDCASVHADDAEAEDAVRTAVTTVDLADLGDQAAEDAVDDTEAFELSWYATQEIEELLTQMASR